MKITPIAAASMMGAVALIALPAIAHADDSYLFLSPSATNGCAMENDDRDGTAGSKTPPGSHRRARWLAKQMIIGATP